MEVLYKPVYVHYVGARMSQKPNIVYLNSHDSGRMIQPMGYAVSTPNLQELAENGVLFRRAFTAAPTCSPSRAALMTGEAPHCCGVTGLSHRGFSITKPEHFLPHTLSAHGYHTAAWGMPDNHTGARNTDIGSGYQEELDGDPTKTESDKSILEFLARDHDKPFFLSVSHTLTHRIGAGFVMDADTEQEDPRYTMPPPPYSDTPTTARTGRILPQTFVNSIAAMAW